MILPQYINNNNNNSNEKTFFEPQYYRCVNQVKCLVRACVFLSREWLKAANVQNARYFVVAAAAEKLQRTPLQLKRNVYVQKMQKLRKKFGKKSSISLVLMEKTLKISSSKFENNF